MVNPLPPLNPLLAQQLGIQPGNIPVPRQSTEVTAPGLPPLSEKEAMAKWEAEQYMLDRLAEQAGLQGETGPRKPSRFDVLNSRAPGPLMPLDMVEGPLPLEQDLTRRLLMEATDTADVPMPPILDRPRKEVKWGPNPKSMERYARNMQEDVLGAKAGAAMGEHQDEFEDMQRRLDEEERNLPQGEGMTRLERFDFNGDGIIDGKEEELWRTTMEGDVEAQAIREGRGGQLHLSGFDTPEEVDAKLAENFPDLAGDLAQPNLSRTTTRPKFGAAQGVMVRVPPQLRGKHGFSGEAIQLVAPEQAEGMRALMAEVSEEDAVRAAQDTGIGAAGRTQRDVDGEETSVDAIGADVTGRERLRYVAGPAEGGVARSPSDLGAGKAGAIFDARFHELDPETGQPVPRGDYRSQAKAAYEGDALRLSPSRIRRLAADPQLDLVADPETGRPNLQILPTEYDKERSKLFFSAMEKRKADKAKRLATRRRRSRERYGQQGGDPYINVPRFPGESDAAYAQRYSAMAGALGQSMTGGGDMGGMMGMMGNMFPAIMNYMLQQGQQGDSRRQQGIMNAMTQVAQAQAALDTWQQNNQGRNPAQSIEAKPLLAALAEAKSRVTQLQNSPQARPMRLPDFFGGRR